MSNMSKYFLALAGLLIMSGLALAQGMAMANGPLPEVDVKKATDALIFGISSVNWLFICAGGGLIVILALRYLLLPRLKGKPLAIAACVLIAVASALTTLILSPADWMGAIMIGIGAGIAAGKAWDLIPDSWTKAFNSLVEKKADKRAAKKAAKRANGG